MTPNLECKRCGQCCRESIIEVTRADLARAPELKAHVHGLRGGYRWSMVNCPLLTSDNLCSIYARRPRECREFRVGSNSHLCPQSPQSEPPADAGQ